MYDININIILIKHTQNIIAAPSEMLQPSAHGLLTMAMKPSA